VQLGKLACRGLINAVSPGRLVHVINQLSNRHFLVDTGAAFSVFPHSSSSPPVGPALAGAAGQPILCWGERQFRLSFNGKVFLWPFLLVTVQFPILGVDFLRHFGLLVDPAGDRLVDRLTGQAVLGGPPEAGDCLYMASSLQRDSAATPHPTGLFSPAFVWAHRPLLFPPASPRVHRPLPFTPASPWPCRPLQPPVAGQLGPQASHV
jgi:hypothetical protein